MTDRGNTLARLTTVFVTSAIAVGCTHDDLPRSPVDRPWPAPVTTQVPPPELPLSPEDALATFTMPPGYSVELAAAEPLLKDPILAEFDGDGRLWVLEMHSFAYHPDMSNSFDPINELVVLEDANDDGMFDTRTVFMGELIMPRAFKILDKNCALVGAPPNLFHACDLDGDLVSDTREVIETTFATQGVVEHGANGLYWGMDNTIVVSEHEWNLQRNAHGFHTAPSLRRGQWGVTQDNSGRIYRNVNTDPLFVDYIAPEYYARNPNLIRTTGLYDNLVNQDDTLIWPARPTPGLNRGYRVEMRRPDGSSSYYGGVSSPMIYRGDRLPEELYEQAFVVDGPTNLVHMLYLKDDGEGQLSAGDYYEKGEFLNSPDERFRPVALIPGWDGTFYVLDMYRGVSQDGPLQTDYLRTYINERKLWEHINLGRLYRVTYTGWRADEKPSMSDDTAEDLVAHLSHTNGWWRDTAQQLLIQRADPAAVPALKALTQNSDNQHARLHAVWTLSGLDASGLDALDADTVTAALQDEWWAIRAAGLRLAERWLRDGDAAMLGAVMARLDDGHWQVRRQLAASLGALPVNERVTNILRVLRLYGDDKVVVDAAISGLAGIEDGVLEVWLDAPDPHPDVAGMLAGAIAKRIDIEATEQLIKYSTNADHSDGVRIALLEGMKLGLEGADGRVRGQAVAGGRAGSRPPGMRPPPTPSIRIELPTEPSALAAMADGNDALAEAANNAIAVTGWPGKPRQLARARSEAEEALFQSGKEIYAGLCVGCHGAEGQGMANIGAALAGSEFVTGDASISARILLHGKEGSIGLMPPVAGFTDEQIAAVITYIRGSFGNIADPVPTVAAKEYRQAYVHRDSPWTDEELSQRAR
ncbi:MAG: c-type cytochrome [Gammaproteobacteria bacterium]|nr:c-type cytochrome [Gammaproteobacteria bacterium]